MYAKRFRQAIVPLKSTTILQSPCYENIQHQPWPTTQLLEYFDK